MKSYRGAILTYLRAGLIRVGYHSKPQFLIIGAQKAGTTSLYYYLSEHPKIVPGNDKEIGFFTPEMFIGWIEHPNYPLLCSQNRIHFSNPEAYRKAARWYHSQFPLPHELGWDCLTYEATPEYLYYPGTAERIFKYNPQMRLIVLLRNPVERAFSAWNMYCHFGDYVPFVYAPKKETRVFDEAVQDEIDKIQSCEIGLEPGYVRRGLYEEQLLRYFRFFKRDQFLILDSLVLKNNTTDVVEQAVRFLGLPEFRHPREWPSHIVGTYTSQIPGKTFQLLKEFYKPPNEKLYQLLDYDFGW